MRESVWAVVLVLFILVGAANATMYQNSVALPHDIDASLELPKYNGAMSDLAGVYLLLQVRLTNARAEYDNDEEYPVTQHAYVTNTVNSLTTTASFNKAGGGVIAPSDLFVYETHTFALGATSGDPVGSFDAQPGPPPSVDYGNWQPALFTRQGEGNIDSNYWDSFVGSGSFTITINTTYNMLPEVAGSKVFERANSPDGELYAQVIYTTTPEPATFALLGLGLGLLRRRVY